MGMRPRTSALGFGALVAVLVATSCRDATTVLVEARTNLAYRGGLVVSFTVGAPGETEGGDITTESRDAWGPDGFIGSLAVVPGSADDASLAVRVVLGVDREARECKPPDYRGCIVTRRRLRYTPHERLRLPVTLYAQCKDVPCDASSTCNLLGQCVDAQVAPSTCSGDEGCTLVGDPQRPGPPPPADASVDVTDAPTDAGASDGRADADARADATTDAADSGTTAGTPGVFDCPPTTCATGQKCCYDAMSGTGYCESPATACVLPGGSFGITVTCDGNEDCGVGQLCCAAAGYTMACASSCGPYAVVCHSTNHCDAKQCTGLFGGHYKYCQ